MCDPEGVKWDYVFWPINISILRIYWLKRKNIESKHPRTRQSFSNQIQAIFHILARTFKFGLSNVHVWLITKRQLLIPTGFNNYRLKKQVAMRPQRGRMSFRFAELKTFNPLDLLAETLINIKSKHPKPSLASLNGIYKSRRD